MHPVFNIFPYTSKCTDLIYIYQNYEYTFVDGIVTALRLVNEIPKFSIQTNLLRNNYSEFRKKKKKKTKPTMP